MILEMPSERGTMSEKLKPVCCGCGGEAIILKADEYHRFPDTYYVSCTKCTAGVGPYDTEAEAVKAWNRAMGERTAKVVHKQQTHIVTPKSTTVAYETETNLWVECGNCGAMGMYHGWKYCPNCGAKLDWSE